MASMLTFMSNLIYGTGADEVMSPNHASWTTSNPSPSGTAWLARFIDGPTSTLGVFEAWSASNGQVPIQPWDGTEYSPWDTLDEANRGEGLPLPASLQPTSLSFSSEAALGAALRDRLDALPSSGMSNATRRPWDHRFWGYLKWAQLILRRYRGELVDFDPPILRDWDGTILTAVPFLNYVNHAHWRWHDFSGQHGQPNAASTIATPFGSLTPGFQSSVGQRAAAATAGGTANEQRREFLYFHRDHIGMYHRWLSRTDQPEQPGINMLSVWTGTFGDAANRGFPPAGAGTPSTWVETDNVPWTNTEADEAGDEDLRTTYANRAALAGFDMGAYHAEGHNVNPDITHPLRNNFNPRFFSWHVFLDDQWLLREPRFVRFDDTTGLRERIFRPVLPGSGAAWPGLSALTIVRDPLGGADTVSPAGAISGLNLTSGAGTLRIELEARDTYGRLLTLNVNAVAHDDAAGTTSDTVSLTHTVGPGGDFALDTPFTLDLVFTTAFASDDPTGANPAVGFQNSRIRVEATLAPQAGADGDFTHQDFIDIELIQEKQAPDVDVYLDLSSFGEEQVASRLALNPAEARFSNAITVTVQDRTARPAPISWPAEVLPELRNLLSPLVPCAGLFSDAAHAPTPALLRPTVDTPFTGVTVELASGPHLEDPSRPDNLPQRYTYRYDVVFAPGHDAFAGLAPNAEQFARLRFTAADRAGNSTTEQLPVKLFRAANPYMVDGDPSWLSDDTRVFRIFQGETLFTITMGTDPNAFIQALLTRLNNPAVPEADRVAFFESLPTFSGQDQLQYSTQITNPSTGVTRNVYNFALAAVRNQGNSGASQVRAFFRLFTYTAANLVFDDGSADPNVGGYRTHTAGATRVPLLGYSSSGETTSIPFFAVPRQPFSASMEGQAADTPNILDFSGGTNAEQIAFAGAWLDINQSSAQLPGSRGSAPNGPFAASEVQPIRTLIQDAHQCMVCEIVYDPDPTQTGDRPATSDNLAQRNLTILTSDNPGEELTRTLQHSFDADTARQVWRKGQGEFDERQTAIVATVAPPEVQFVGTETDLRVRKQHAALPDRFRGHGEEHPEVDLESVALASHVLAFDAVDWRATGNAADELMVVWNGLPEGSRVEMYLPGVDARTVVNLRNVRHAPRDVWVADEHTLRLRPGGVTWIPLPPTPEARVNGIMTIVLPEGVEAGQRWRVDVLQVRGATRQTLGGFSLDVRVDKDRVALAHAERRLLATLFERLSLKDPRDRWYPILRRRVEHSRARAEALARRAGIPWVDPTRWVDPTKPQDPSAGGVLEGPALRIVLEKIEIRKDYDPLIKGRGEIFFDVRVSSTDNGGQLVRHRLPSKGIFKVGDKPGQNMIQLDRTVFEGHAHSDLRLEIVGTERDTFDPDDWIGRFSRVFCGDSRHWFGHYGPGGKGVVPEDVGPWRVWYRIERGATLD